MTGEDCANVSGYESNVDRLVADRNGESRLAFSQIRCYDHSLMNDPADWRWSKYNGYAGCEDIPLAMDEPDF